ncbi:hypothetical protein MOK15_20985 [Sphingobium sp. BYY-5]|uniref:hypothetical protein n=1 Tax=Sphingobium sp. BYY-5 TaxID=2926400 RepID=UPI001FA73B6B|nr:hypothetical protein [Sphingobium sp. BYY-5]MCI4592538.1 hypothetical protein [Sphingobium sp. BYY-5]
MHRGRRHEFLLGVAHGKGMILRTARMPLDTWEVFTLHRIGHLSYGEIAKRKRTFK